MTLSSNGFKSNCIRSVLFILQGLAREGGEKGSRVAACGERVEGGIRCVCVSVGREADISQPPDKDNSQLGGDSIGERRFVHFRRRRRARRGHTPAEAAAEEESQASGQPQE